MTIKHRVFEAAGRLVAPLDVALMKRSDTTQARRVDFCSQARINLVLDVGAASGMYAKALRAFGYNDRIVSFEPLPDSFAILERESAHDSLWLARQIALGDKATTSTMHVTTQRDSSSLLPMTNRHLEGAPNVTVDQSIEVEVTRLDQDLGVIESRDRCLLKIDAQGFEHQVISGASGVLDSIHLMELELSLVPLYSGAMLYREMIDHVAKLGFEPIWFEHGFQDRQTGRLLQMDGIFARP